MEFELADDVGFVVVVVVVVGAGAEVVVLAPEVGYCCIEGGGGGRPGRWGRRGEGGEEGYERGVGRERQHCCCSCGCSEMFGGAGDWG